VHRVLHGVSAICEADPAQCLLERRTFKQHARKPQRIVVRSDDQVDARSDTCLVFGVRQVWEAGGELV
jgi:hypothetical protein